MYLKRFKKWKKTAKHEVIQVAIEPDEKAAFNAWRVDNSTRMSAVMREAIAPSIALGKERLEDQA